MPALMTPQFLKVANNAVVKHRTTVAYSRAQCLSAEKMSEALERNILVRVDDFEGDLLLAIVEGARSSPELASQYKEML